MESTNWKKMNRGNFEYMLVRSLKNTKDVSKRKHYEMSIDDDNNEKTVLLWLYYNSNGHIGTWQKGDCWVFESNF